MWYLFNLTYVQLAFSLAEVKAAEHDSDGSDNEWDYQLPAGTTVEALSEIAEVSSKSIQKKIDERDAVKKASLSQAPAPHRSPSQLVSEALGSPRSPTPSGSPTLPWHSLSSSPSPSLLQSTSHRAPHRLQSNTNRRPSSNSPSPSLLQSTSHRSPPDNYKKTQGSWLCQERERSTQQNQKHEAKLQEGQGHKNEEWCWPNRSAVLREDGLDSRR